MEFIEMVHRETIVTDAKRAALKIQSSTARVILIFCWYTDVKRIFLELASRNVSKLHGCFVLNGLRSFDLYHRQIFSHNKLHFSPLYAKFMFPYPR